MVTTLLTETRKLAATMSLMSVTWYSMPESLDKVETTRSSEEMDTTTKVNQNLREKNISEVATAMTRSGLKIQKLAATTLVFSGWKVTKETIGFMALIRWTTSLVMT
jgi:hypothetical protein